MAEKKNKGYLSGREIRAIAKANAKEIKRLEAYKNRKCDESECASYHGVYRALCGADTHFVNDVAERRIDPVQRGGLGR